MKNNTKLIMETWRRFINENQSDEFDVLRDEPEEGYYDDEYNPEGDMVDMNSEPYHDDYNPEGFDPDEDGYDESGKEFQSRYGQYNDPELPAPEGEPVSDEDLEDDFDVVRDEPEEGYYDDEYNQGGFDPDYDER